METKYEGFIQNIKNVFKSQPEVKVEPITKLELVNICNDSLIELIDDNNLSISYNLTEERLKFDHAGNYSTLGKNINFSIQIENYDKDNTKYMNIYKEIKFNINIVKSRVLFLIEILTYQYKIIDIYFFYKSSGEKVTLQEFEKNENIELAELIIYFKNISR